MPSSYTSSNRFEKPGLLEQDGTWGTTLNTDYDLIDAAISGYTSIAMADANYSLTVVSGAADQARIAFLNFTGTLTATRTITIPAVSKLRVIANNTTQSLTFSTGSGTTLTLIAGLMAITSCDGTNVFQVSSNTTNATTLNGQAASYYLNAANLASGTVPLARLQTGSSTQPGILQVVNSTASTAIDQPASAAATKAAYDLATTANTAAGTAQSAANSAQSTANSAQSTANTAQANANTAINNAANAQSTANTAATNAASAQSTATTANNTANTAIGNAATAQSTANGKANPSTGTAGSNLVDASTGTTFKCGFAAANTSTITFSTAFAHACTSLVMVPSGFSAFPAVISLSAGSASIDQNYGNGTKIACYWMAMGW